MSDPAPARDDDDVLEAVFRHQFTHHAALRRETAALYCLALDDDQDPSADFLRRFAAHLPPVVAASRCALTAEGEVQDRDNGAPALLFRVTALRRLGDDEAEARAEYLEGWLCGAGSTYRVVRRDGQWVVTDDRMRWIS
ncbi:MAG TPA: hypothetical protein VH741_00105 [Candidatus Limnocylindrales bacterium]|jgi:hypothetical protein